MRKMIWALALVLLPAMGLADGVLGVKSLPLAVNWDVDGEGADAAQIVTQVNGDLTDGKTFTITASPDVCRLVDMTVTDANSSITAGIVTVVGTDCWGDALTATFDFSVVATRGSGVKTLTPSAAAKASGAYFKTVTSVTTNTLTGEGGAGVDFMTLGYSTGSPYQYPLYGVRVNVPFAPFRRVDITTFYESRVQVKQGSSSTTITAVTASTNPFNAVAVGDLIGLSVYGTPMPLQWRKVTVRTDADNITVDFPIVIAPNSGTTGQSFVYKKFYLSSDPQDGWIPVFGLDALDFLWNETTTGANTGGLVSNVECGYITSTPLPTIQVDTDTVNSGATGSATSSVDERLFPYEQCRFGLKFGTTDDADATAATTEGVYVSIGTRR